MRQHHVSVSRLLKTAAVWAAIGVAIAASMLLVGRCCVDALNERDLSDAVYATYRVLWPTSQLVPPLVDSADPSRTYNSLWEAVLANALPCPAGRSDLHLQSACTRSANALTYVPVSGAADCRQTACDDCGKSRQFTADRDNSAAGGKVREIATVHNGDTTF